MTATTKANTGEVPRPPFWVRFTVPVGNAIQIAGLLISAGLLYYAGHTDSGLRVLVMLLAWLIVYCCCHALAHYIVGRLVGIHFKGYGLRGTDHPEAYPPPMKQLMSILPFFTVMTEKASMEKASGIAKALMFSAGETSSTVCAILVGWYAWHKEIPGGGILLIFSIIFSVIATISTTVFPKGDYHKMLKALRSK